VIKKFAIVQVTDRNMRQLQENISQALNPVLQNAFVDGSLLPDVSLSTGNNQVAHGLGRVAQGRAFVYESAAADVYDYQKPDEKFFYLNASAPLTVSLYVF